MTPERGGFKDSKRVEALLPWLESLLAGNTRTMRAAAGRRRFPARTGGRAPGDPCSGGLERVQRLDVFEDEPNVPPELLPLDNVLLTPHLGGRSPDAEQAMARLLADNLAAHFEGRALPTPIPG